MKSKVKRIRRIYQRLFREFGRQYWWPGETPFEVVIGAILTQNTSWSNVERAIKNLKDKNLLTPLKLHNLKRKKLSQLIRPAGYFNIKAKRLAAFLDFLFSGYQGSLKRLFALPRDKLRHQLLGVYGIGPETADSIILYAAEKPVFVVDAYTKRILLRHKLISDSATYEDIQNLFMQNLSPDMKPRSFASASAKPRRSPEDTSGRRRAKLFNEYHALLVKLGKDICKKTKPKCDICPIKKI